jgi:hypothetical protein
MASPAFWRWEEIALQRLASDDAFNLVRLRC